MRKSKFKTIAIVFLISLTNFAFGQKQAEIIGKIINTKNSNPVAFATIGLYTDIDSALIKGVLSDEKGEFIIKEIENNNYFLKISYLGFKTTIIPELKINTPKNYNAGEISLNPEAIEIDEVSVESERLTGKVELDKTVYNINDKVRSVSASGIDVLKYIPEVSVDFMSNVTLEGRSDIKFYVNDIERDKDFVAQIDPKSIDKVEIITNPSVKYSADISGVINIYTKKEAKYGLNGSLTLEIPSPDAVVGSGRLNLDYGVKNFRFYVSDNFHIERFNVEIISNTTINSGNNIEKQLKNGKGIFSQPNNNFSYGFDWFLDEYNTINFYGNYRTRNEKNKDIIFDNQIFNNEILTSLTQIKQNKEDKTASNYYSIFYKKKFKNPNKEFTLQTGYYDYDGNITNGYENKDIDIVTNLFTNTYTRKEFTENKRKSYDFKTTYSQIIGKAKIDLGYYSYYQTFDNEMKNVSDAEPFTFVYNELRQAGYTNLSFKLKSLNFQTGIRTEFSKTNIDENAENQYFCLLPQIGISRKFKNSQTVKLNFRRRIYRPGINEMNPFETWSDSLSVFRGNSELSPAFSNDLELSYSKNFNSNYLSPKIFVNYLTDDFNQVKNITDNNITETTINNIGKSWEYGLSFTGAFQLTKMWRITGFANIYNKVVYENNAVGNNEIKREKITFQTNATSIINPYKDYNFFLMVQYKSPELQYQSTRHRDPLFLIGLEKSIFENGSITFIYLPPYTKTYTFNETITETDDFYYKNSTAVNFDYFFIIQFSYNFSKGKKVKKLRRSTEYDAEKGKSMF